MKLAIIGSRNFNDYPLLCREVNKLSETHDITTIVSGGARGADLLGKRYAKECYLGYIEYPADWAKYGKSAGFRRNADIVNNSDIVIAFWDGQSRGTEHGISLATKSGKTVVIVPFGVN